MPTIVLHTYIEAPVEVCFDMSRNIDIHMESTKQTGEKAIAGKISGLIGLNEQVTWQATHFGIRQKLTTRITAFDYPFSFTDEQVKGAFAYMKHDHYFRSKGNGTIMEDVFSFSSPLGFLGMIFNYFILTDYMKRLLITRNKIIKHHAESAHKN